MCSGSAGARSRYHGVIMQTVLITGAASGIGRAAALHFAALGWRCVMVDRDDAALASLRPRLCATAGAEHLALQADLTRDDQIGHLAAQLPELDALINNAGMSDTSGILLAEQEATQLARIVALNLAAPAALVRACAHRLRPGARIVNVASGAGLRAIPLRGGYSATKAGLIAQSQALAAARPDWRVTVLCPGFVRTELVESLMAAGRLDPRQAVAKIPLARMADPQEMAEALCFLAGEGAAPLHGQVLALDGGSSVYGGSVPFNPAQHAPLAADAPLAWSTYGDADGRWAGLQDRVDASAGAAANSYAAVLDASALDASDSIASVHQAARRYADRHARHASLTLLLPALAPDADWERRGIAAATRMLVATLACELAPRALRINAVELAAQQTPSTLIPLLRYVGGPRAQYLTGQTLHIASTETDGTGHV